MYAEINDVRSAARRLVRELDLLEGGMCCDGLSFSECHLLTELESLGQATASELADSLVLEKSTVSRLVNGLIERGLLAFVSDPSDRRRRLLSLTGDGCCTNERINTLACSQVKSALSMVPPADRPVVAAGLERYAKALRYARLSGEYTIRPIEHDDNPALRRVIVRVMEEFGATGCGYSSEDAELNDMAAAYAGDRATFFAISNGSRIVGCGGMGPLENGAEDVCEIRKMYLLPEARGRGLGIRLLDEVIASAREAGYSTCYLETIESMAQARRLYEKFGFKPLDQPLGDTGHPGCNQYMSMTLN